MNLNMSHHHMLRSVVKQFSPTFKSVNLCVPDL